jgi:hypothetical protein
MLSGESVIQTGLSYRPTRAGNRFLGSLKGLQIGALFLLAGGVGLYFHGKFEVKNRVPNEHLNLQHAVMLYLTR